MIPDRAFIASGARLGRGVSVAPFALIEDRVEIGDGCDIGSHVILRSGTVIGPGCRLGAGVVLGDAPSDVAYKGEATAVRIGRDNDLREYVTVHRSTGPDTATLIGDHNFIMSYVHIAHNCRIGNHVTITNACNLGGHVQVGDHAVLGGLSGIHQFVRVGAYAMLGACSYLSQDLPPYMLASGNPCRVRGINATGLKRAEFSSERLRLLRAAHRKIYRSRLGFSDALKAVLELDPESADLRTLAAFAAESRRGILLKSSGGGESRGLELDR